MEKKNDSSLSSQKSILASDLLSKLNDNIGKNPSKGVKYSTAQKEQPLSKSATIKTETIKPAKSKPMEEKSDNAETNIDINVAKTTLSTPDEPEISYGSVYHLRIKSRKSHSSLLPPPKADIKNQRTAQFDNVKEQKTIPEQPPLVRSAPSKPQPKHPLSSELSDELPPTVADRYEGFGQTRPVKNNRAELQKRIEDAEKYITNKQVQKSIVMINETSSPEDEDETKIANAANTVVADNTSSAENKEIDPDFDETDMNLMIAFGMEAELEKRVGSDKATEIGHNIDEASGTIEEKLVRTGELSNKKKTEEEFTAVSQAKEIFRRYKYEYSGLLWRIITCSILLIISFFYENIELFRGSLPSMIDPKSYPVVHILIGLQILVLATALIYKQLLSGLQSFVKMRPSPESALVVIVILSAIYHIVISFIGVYSGVRLYNFPVILAILLMLFYEFNNLKREIYSFDIASSKANKYTVDKISPEEAQLEKDAFYEYLPESPVMFRIGKVKFVDGFYRRMRAPVSNKKALNFIIPIVIALSAVFFGVALAVIGDLYAAILLAYVSLVISMPFSIFITYSYPFYIASKEAYENESAIIGEASLEEYAKASVISFDDSDVFPSSGVKLKTVKVFGDNRIDRVINDVKSVFIEIGGPLSEVFEIATLDMQANEDKAEIIEISDDGIEAMLGKRRILVGKGEFLRRNDFEPVNYREDEALENGGEITVMYMVINHEVVAKMYIQYIIDADFEFTLNQLYKSGMCVGIKTLDPNINDVMLSSRVKISKYAVKVLKCHEPFDTREHTERADSGVITKGSSKSLLQTLALCDKVLHIVKTNTVVKIFAIIISAIIMSFLLILNIGSSVMSIYVALYQMFWIIPMVIISKLFL